MNDDPKQPAASVKPITSSIMIDDGGETPAYCVMAAYRNRADAETVLAAMNSAAPVAAQAQPHKTPSMHAAVRKVMKQHNLTTVGDGVIEADLIHAVLSAQAASKPARPTPLSWTRMFPDES